MFKSIASSSLPVLLKAPISSSRERLILSQNSKDGFVPGSNVNLPDASVINGFFTGAVPSNAALFADFLSAAGKISLIAGALTNVSNSEFHIPLSHCLYAALYAGELILFAAFLRSSCIPAASILYGIISEICF